MAQQFLKNTKQVTTSSLVVILFVFFGILIAAQLRSLPSRVSNPITPYSSLKETRESLYGEQKQLKEEIKRLHEDIQKFQVESDNLALSQDQLKTLREKGALAGLAKISGTGIQLIMNDSKATNPTENSIIHASDLRDVVNVLWGGGAEGISINGQRIVINSAIDCIVNTILINDVRISGPFVVEAIGNRDILSDRLLNSINLDNLRSRNAKEGLTFEINKKDEIILPLFTGSFEYKNEASK